MFNPGRNSTLCFAALFWAPAFGVGCHRSLTPGWGHSCPGHPQLWPFGDSDLFFQISLLLLLLFLFLTKSCCGNQKMVWTWKRTHRPSLPPPFFCPSACSSWCLCRGRGDLEPRGLCAALSAVGNCRSGIPFPQDQLQILLPTSCRDVSSALSCRAQEQSVKWAKCRSPTWRGGCEDTGEGPAPLSLSRRPDGFTHLWREPRPLQACYSVGG